MDKGFQARLRAERIVRPATHRERVIRAAFWLVTGAIITVLIIAIPGSEANVFAFLPLLAGIASAVIAGRKFQVTEFSAQGASEIREAKHEDRLERLAEWKKRATHWFSRLLVSAAVIACCWLYAYGPQTLSTDEALVLAALVVSALILAWETSLVLAVFGGLWWLTTLNWHISTPTAVIIGAVIIAIAINEKR